MATAIQSKPTGTFFAFFRKTSRNHRLIRLRAAAFFETPLRTEQANRLTSRPFGRVFRSSVSPRRVFPSLSRRWRSGPESRRARPNLSCPAGNYGMSLRRPFWRRRRSTFLPGLLDIRRRNPCRCLRFKLDLSVRCFFTRALYHPTLSNVQPSNDGWTASFRSVKRGFIVGGGGVGGIGRLSNKPHHATLCQFVLLKNP